MSHVKLQHLSYTFPWTLRQQTVHKLLLVLLFCTVCLNFSLGVSTPVKWCSLQLHKRLKLTANTWHISILVEFTISLSIITILEHSNKKLMLAEHTCALFITEIKLKCAQSNTLLLLIYPWIIKGLNINVVT